MGLSTFGDVVDDGSDFVDYCYLVVSDSMMVVMMVVMIEQSMGYIP